MVGPQGAYLGSRVKIHRYNAVTVVNRPAVIAMFAVTERRGIHGSASWDTQPIHAIKVETHNAII
jgi:hypothetical protein